MTNEPGADFYVVDSGLGDSLLLCLDDVWIAVDCHLPRSGENAVWDRYVRLLVEKRVDRLSALIISHFHIDHFRGAARLIQWFHEDGRKGIGKVCLTGGFELANLVKALWGIYRRTTERGELAQFAAVLSRYSAPRGPLLVPMLVADSEPMEIASTADGWHVVAVHPFRIPSSAMVAQAVEAVQNKQRPFLDQNLLSGAYFVCHRHLKFPLLLLGGDVPGEKPWEDALSFWKRRKEFSPGYDWLPTGMGPVWIKVPHHGSHTHGHSNQLFEAMAPPYDRHAFVTAGADRRKHPARETLIEYRARKFTLWDTGRLERARPSMQIPAYSFGQQAFAYGAGAQPPSNEPDPSGVIQVNWPENRPTPQHARIRPKEIASYPSVP